MNELVPIDDNTLRTSIENVKRDVSDLDTPEDRFDVLDAALVFTAEIRRVANLYLAAVLALHKKNWPNFPLTLTDKWGYDFYAYAKDKTGGYARNTIDNLINVGETWLINGLPEQIPDEVQEYDKKGNPVEIELETGECVPKMVPPDPLKQNVSKLLVAIGSLNDGRLDRPKALGQLFNSDVSVREFNSTLKDEPRQAPPPQESFGLKIMWPFIIAVDGRGDEQEVARFNEDNHPLVARGATYLIRACQMKELK